MIYFDACYLAKFYLAEPKQQSSRLSAAWPGSGWLA